MDPLTLALATFGVQKLRGKSTGRSFRDAFLVGGGAYGIGQMGGAGMGIGQGAPFSGLKSLWGAPGTAGVTHGHAPLNVAATKGTGIRGIMQKAGPWWQKQSTAAKLGYGTAAAVGLGEVFKGDDPKPPFTEEDYKKAYEKQSQAHKGIGDYASNWSAVPSLYSNQNVYSYNTGGLASVQKFNQGGVSYLPSKTTHDEKDTHNYIRAGGYLEDPQGDKDEDTILAQLADGEFVSRADAILGAGILEGASISDRKEMRKKGATFFYDQQKKFKRIFDLLHASKKTEH
jgi:hypothetical protein|tara:strand:+ start:194 stop:1051 length:858 start_codon:yes stop_codon:yes gene_type:complete